MDIGGRTGRRWRSAAAAVGVVAVLVGVAGCRQMPTRAQPEPSASYQVRGGDDNFVAGVDARPGELTVRVGALVGPERPDRVPAASDGASAPR
ncbi:hypothetical protein OG985_32900 [Streptomyces sp. NBC_00289]|uniref:hypothetical protein n=1 Tax=Streptomyces sp. NBC_00289 TaxID=2975703 RepID=UPI0032470533